MKFLRVAVALPFILVALIFFALSVFSMFFVDHITGCNHSAHLFNW